MTHAPAPVGASSAGAPVASFRLRILLRSVFLLLAAATVLLAIVLLQDEKARSYRTYEQALRKTHAGVLERLRQPAGMLALLNPQLPGMPPVRPLLLPYSALDFDGQNTVQHQVEQAGCSLRYPDGSKLCVAVGSGAKAAGVLYLVGSFSAPELVSWDGSSPGFHNAHRAFIRVRIDKRWHDWIAPITHLSGADAAAVSGRISAFDTLNAAAGDIAVAVRGFRGVLWQSARCSSGEPPGCPRRVFYALRLPVKGLRARASDAARSARPPTGLAEVRVHLAFLPPGGGAALFDSDAAAPELPVSLEEALQSLRPGEMLTISHEDGPIPPVVVKGRAAAAGRSSPLLLRLVDGLPVSPPPSPLELHDTLATPAGSYEVRLTGDPRAIEPGLAAIATRVSWYVGAMLGAIALAWLLIELALIRRITVLSRRAAAVSHGVRKDARGGDRIGQLEVSDLRGPDELGVLAGGLADLLQRVKDDVEREELRARQEREMLEAVGHEILSPLQSLMVLFADSSQPAYRYVQRMRHAVNALYGQASPREALKAAQLELVALDFDRFLFHVASNAGFAGIEDVRYEPLGRSVMVRAHEFSLEDVVTHILRNADQHRTRGTPIRMSLRAGASRAVLRIHNMGVPVSEELLEPMFEYGVRESDSISAEAPGHRGQGLFVARTYLAKMGGSVSARNEEGGVSFFVELPLLPA